MNEEEGSPPGIVEPPVPDPVPPTTPEEDAEFAAKVATLAGKRSRWADAMARFTAALGHLPQGPERKGPGLTRDRLKELNDKADRRQVCVAMRREMPETDHDVARIQAAIEKRHRRQVRNLLSGGKMIGQ